MPPAENPMDRPDDGHDPSACPGRVGGGGPGAGWGVDSEVTVVVGGPDEFGVLILDEGVGPLGGVGDPGLELGLEPLPGRVEAPLDGADGGIEPLGDLDQG